MKIKIEDLDAESVNLGTSPTFLKAMEVVTKMGDGKIVTTRRLAQMAKISSRHFSSSFSTEPAFAPFRHKVGCAVYWGNARTILEFKKQNAA